MLYLNNEQFWYQRKGRSKAFIYTDRRGRRISQRSVRNRFEKLVIPPAWKDVRLCPSAQGYIQATGRDARGRKQYIYHPLWRQERETAKFRRILEFGKLLPKIRKSVDEHLREKGLSKQKVISIALRLLDETHMRIGNQEYACQNGTFGLTTLQDHHLKVSGRRIHFTFKGKSGKEWDIDIEDKRLAPLLKACQEVPGKELFRFIDHEGNSHAITSKDVNDHLRKLIGRDFSAKDFRTWYGTVCAVKAFYECGLCKDGIMRTRMVPKVVKQVAQTLINTPMVCRKYYIHPQITEDFLQGRLCRTVEKARKGFRHTAYGLSLEEKATILLMARS